MYKIIHHSSVCDHRRLQKTHTLVNGGLCTMEDIHIMEYYAAVEKSGEVLCTDKERSLRYIAKCKKQGTDSNSANNYTFYVIKRRKIICILAYTDKFCKDS